MNKFVIQITGGREYTDYETIKKAIAKFLIEYDKRQIIVRHGNARGADKLSAMAARALGITNIQSRPVEYYGLSWKNNNGAGNQRNIKMLEEEPIPDVVLAFPDPNSKGTWNMVGFAKEREIWTIVYE